MTRAGLFDCNLPDKALVLGQLKIPSVPPLSVNWLKTGYDNIHSDIYLSPRFLQRLKEYLRLSCRYEVEKTIWKRDQSADVREPAGRLKDAYSDLMRQALTQRKVKNLQLLQAVVLLASLKRLDFELDEQEKFFRQTEYSQGRLLVTYSDGSADHLQLLLQQRGNIRYRVINRLMKILQKTEQGGLRKLRKALLGISWPMSQLQYFNPLLALSDGFPAAEFAAHYPVALLPGEGRLFTKLDKILLQLFGDWLPETVGHRDYPDELVNDEVSSDFVASQESVRQSVSFTDLLHQGVSPAEYDSHALSWLDRPANLLRLLDVEHFQQGRQWRKLQSCLYKKVIRQLHKQQLLRPLIASEASLKLYQEIDKCLNLKLVYRFLSGQMSDLQLQNELPGGLDHKNILNILQQRRRHMRKNSRVYSRWVFGSEGRSVVLGQLTGFLRFRRDLKLVHQLSRFIEQLHLLHEDELDIARSHGNLYEFGLPGDMDVQEQDVIQGHVIIKADVRGSTGLTAMMRKKRLNPASYFNLNLFQPVNALLDEFGAQKIFVEGDAVILGIMQYSHKQQHCVALACGLAKKILKVVEKKNIENRRHGLPEMELGLGIAYVDEAPTFIYDENRRITISPAINRADRLSSCDAQLKQLLQHEQGRKDNVEVLLKPASGDGAEKLLRYNVNGIEMDVPAFFKLKSEFALRNVSKTDDEVLYAGRYPDVMGNLQWLEVREAVLRYWVKNEVGEKEQAARRFYEVITHPDKIRFIRQNFKPRLVGGKKV